MHQLIAPALTMSSRVIAELTGKEHFNVKRDCVVMFDELELDTFTFEGIYLDSMNRQKTEYLLPKDLVETLITGYSIKLRYQVIQRLHELENLLKPTVILPQNLPNALRALADSHEQLQQAQFECEVAIKTKAYINDKKTATAMATASKAVRENQRLKDQLGQSKNNATIRSVAKLTKKSYEWKPLKDWCKANNIKLLKVHDDLHEEVNTYPKDAWLNVYNIDLYALFGGV